MDDQTENCLKFLSRTVFGYIEDKDWAIFRGNRHCGKGVLNEILINSLTSSYMGTTEANYLLCERETGHDDGRKLSWLIDFQFKRLMTTNEIKFDTDNKNLKIDGVLLKKLFSGGDPIQSRKIHKDFIEFNIQSKMLMMCNDYPPITNKDCLESCFEFSTIFQFKTQEEIDELKKSNSEADKYRLNKCRLADPEIKNKIKNNEK